MASKQKYTYENYYKPGLQMFDDMYQHPTRGIETNLNRTIPGYSKADQALRNYMSASSDAARQQMKDWGWDTSDGSFWDKALKTTGNYGILDTASAIAAITMPTYLGDQFRALMGLGILTGATPATSKAWVTKKEARSAAKDSITNLGINANNGTKFTNQQFQEYMRDAINLGIVDNIKHADGLKAYNKLRDNNFKYSVLNKEEAKALCRLTDTLNWSGFKYINNSAFLNLSDEEKMNYLSSGMPGFGGVAAPRYWDTDFAPYQKKVDPITHYTNKELADLYNIDFNFNNILAELNEAAEAQVNLKDWESFLLANNAELDNTQSITDYLDTMRNIKSEAIQKGMSTGARAAAELINNVDAIKNKVQNNYDVATQRFETVNDALLQRANTQIATDKHYDDLAQYLAGISSNLYLNDINRYGSDRLFNANVLSADENLRSTRAAQNNLMRSIYNSANAQINAAKNAAYEPLNYFKTVTLPAYNYDWNRAMSNYINVANSQNYGIVDLPAKTTQLNTK